MNRQSDSQQRAKNGEASEIPFLEWIVGALGVMIVAAAVGVLLYEAIAGDKSPPDIKLTVQTTVQRQNGFLVKIRADNIGGEPAARVEITAELLESGKVVEASGTQFEHLPPRSAHEAGVFFQRDPRHVEIRLQARGYEDP